MCILSDLSDLSNLSNKLSMSALFKPTMIGASISDRSIELVELRRAGKGSVEMRSVASRPLEAGIVEGGKVLDADRLGAALREAARLAKPSFRSKHVTVALPDAATYFHLFRFPGSLTDAEARSALSFQLEEVVPLSSDDLVGAYVVASRSAEETEVFEAVALRDTVRAAGRACERAGFSVEHIVLEAEALQAALLGTERAGRATLVADIGARSTTLVVRDELGMRGTFTKPFAGEVMTDTLAAAKKIPRDKAEALKRSVGLGPKADAVTEKALGATTSQIAREMSRVIAWYRGLESARALDEVVLTGGSAEMPGIAEDIAGRLGASGWKGKVRVGDSLARLNDSALGRAMARGRARSLFAPAIGAALVGLSSPLFEFHGAQSARAASPRHRAALSRHPVADARQFFQFVPPQAKIVAASLFVAASFIVLGLVAFERFQTLPTRTDGIVLEPDQTEGAFVRTLTVSANPAEGDVPARLVTVPEFPVSVSVVPSSTESRDGIATGVVTLSNRTSSDQPLVATTRLLSDDGVLFRLRDSTEVPAGGSVDAAVYADEAGSGGNIGPSHFTIPGLPTSLQDDIDGESAAPMDGGVIRVGILSQADVDAGLVRAGEEATASLAAAFSPFIAADETVRPELARAARLSYSGTADIGSEVDESVLTAVFRLDALAYRPEDLLAVVLADAEEGLSAEIRDVRVLEADPDFRSAVIRVLGTFYPQERAP